MVHNIAPPRPCISAQIGKSAKRKDQSNGIEKREQRESTRTLTNGVDEMEMEMDSERRQ